jgi:hypothetical protein
VSDILLNPSQRIDVNEMREIFESSCNDNILLNRFKTYSATGVFTDDMGRKDDIGIAGISGDQAALLFYLVRKLGANITAETGFGGGISTGVMLAAKQDFASGFRMHFSVDPFGLGDGKWLKVQSFIEENYGQEFARLKDASELALPNLARTYQHKISVCLIDGGHWFETALVDFVFFDRMCPIGGCIVIDDTQAPAIGSLVNYLQANRNDYVADLTVANTAVFWKASESSGRSWDHFEPFVVPDRRNWEPKEEAVAAPARQRRLTALRRFLLQE